MTEFPRKRTLMDEDQLKRWVLRQVGALRLRIELHPADLDDIIEDTKDWYIAHKGQDRECLVEVIAGEPSYVLPEDVDSVLDVIPTLRTYKLTDVYHPYSLGDEPVPYDVYALGANSGGLYSHWYQSQQYMKTADMMFSADFNWTVQGIDEGIRLLLHPIPVRSGTCLVRYKSSNLVIERLPAFEHQFIKRYALATAKIKLGRYRSKYGGFPGAQGERQLDGTAILEEGRADIEKLEEEIRQSCMGIPFLVG